MVKQKKKEKINFVQKTISIPKEQEEFIKNNFINLSRFVQKKLDEFMENGI